MIQMILMLATAPKRAAWGWEQPERECNLQYMPSPKMSKKRDGSCTSFRRVALFISRSSDCRSRCASKLMQAGTGRSLTQYLGR
jgi:hypothetical protein